MAATTTIRLPPRLRARIQSLAKQSDRSAHSVILEAVERYAAHEEQMRTLVKEALAEDASIERGAAVYGAADVHAWLGRLAVNDAPARPKPRRPKP